MMRQFRHRRGLRGGRRPPGGPDGPWRRTVRLVDVPTGGAGRIARIDCTGKFKRRLMEMGVIPGTPFTVERFAPLGDPIQLKFNGYCLSLRKEEAGHIWVHVSDEWD